MEELQRCSDTVNGNVKERVVFKCGRTTGKTWGRLATVGADVWMRYGLGNGGAVITKGKVLLVISPVGCSGYPLWIGDPSGNIAFATVGDSGSLVYDYKGRVLGMYIGGQPNNLGKMFVAEHETYASLDGIHFITPIDATLKDIRDTLERLFPTYDRVEVNML